MVAVRRVQVSDAPAILKLNEKLDEETSFMLMEPGERQQLSVEEQAARLATIAASPREAMFVAEVGTELVGFVVVAGNYPRRARHTARLIIGVRCNHWGRGVGKALMREAEDWSRESDVHRLELTVMATNHRARDLYERMGFEREGLRRDALYVDGVYVDELYMAKLL